jgi:hypothetical protein
MPSSPNVSFQLFLAFPNPGRIITLRDTCALVSQQPRDIFKTSSRLQQSCRKGVPEAVWVSIRNTRKPKQLPK